VAITGPSGSGKSTLLDLLGLVLRPDAAGCFMFAPGTAAAGIGVARDIARLWANDDRDGLAAIRASSIGYVLQTGGLLPFLNAIENISLSRALLGLADGDGFVDRLTAALGIDRLRTKMPHALSIGERQRVAIARALAHRPALLLADEPTAALDPGQAVRVIELLLAIVRELGVSCVFVTHDWDLVKAFGLREVRAEVVAGGEGSLTRFIG
jgi:putative ABC transport system ATP-binding protein